MFQFRILTVEFEVHYEEPHGIPQAAAHRKWASEGSEGSGRRIGDRALRAVRGSQLTVLPRMLLHSYRLAVGCGLRTRKRSLLYSSVFHHEGFDFVILKTTIIVQYDKQNLSESFAFKLNENLWI